MSNDATVENLRKILEIFVASEGNIRPHSILTGPSGSSKTFTVETLCVDFKIPMIEINAAQLTKEGTSGNSLSKALTPLMQLGGNLAICLVDEFDKLFISGNSNSQLAHETTNGVQNEFLKILEGKTTSVYGEYGKYVDVTCDNVLFIFSGAFNGEEDITLDRLRELGIKTEFLGRVGLTFPLTKITLADLENILNDMNLLEDYLKLFPEASKEQVTDVIMTAVKENYEKNTIGVRILSTLVHQYFINGGNLLQEQIKQSTFQKTLSLKSNDVH